MRSPIGRSHLRRLLLGGLVVFLAIQLVPYGWRHPNPPVTEDAPWSSDRARTIASESCYACHSNETRWPPHAYVAPMSWLVRRDVDLGRDELNFSRWDDDEGEADDAIESIVDGGMPPRRYVLVHPGARLSEQEAQILTDALADMQR